MGQRPQFAWVSEADRPAPTRWRWSDVALIPIMVPVAFAALVAYGWKHLATGRTETQIDPNIGQIECVVKDQEG